MDKKPKVSAAERQKLLDEISGEDLAKIQAHQASTEGSLKVDNEWLLLTEFALLFGWQAYLDVKDDKIDMAQMLTLIAGSRKIDARKMYEQSHVSFIASLSARAKKPVNQFKSLTKSFIKKMKADQ